MPQQRSVEVNGLDTPTPNPPRFTNNEKFASRWKAFEAGVHGLSDFTQYIGALETNLEKGRRLEPELRNKTVRISNLEAGRQQMLEGFGESYAKWSRKEMQMAQDLQKANESIHSLETQIAQLKRDFISNDVFHDRLRETEDEASQKAREVEKSRAAEVQNLKKEVERLEKKLTKSEAALSKESTLRIGGQELLKRCQSELKENKTDMGLEEMSTDLFVDCGTEIWDLSMRFRGLAKRCFFTNIPKELKPDDVFNELQHSRCMSVISRLIPVSNSDASKHFRMAAAESIIAKKLADKLLQPLYIVDLTVKKALEDVLDRLFTKNPRQESILRSLLLAACVSEGDTRESRIIKAVVDDVKNILKPLLFEQTQHDAFVTGLHTLLCEALDLWSQAQKSPERILASTEVENGEWGFHDEHEDAVSLTAEQTAFVPSSEEPLMALFPRVYSVTASAALHSGFALWSNQGIVVAGDLESKEQASRVKARKERTTNAAVKRRVSVSSPTTNLSFNQRMKSNSEPTANPNTESNPVVKTMNGKPA